MMRGLAVLLMVATAVPVHAQDSQKGDGTSTVDAVTKCRTVAADADRLACYDRAADALTTARESGGLVVMDRAEVREKRRSLFGLRLPDINLFGRNEAREPAIREVASTVTGMSRFGRDRYTVKLADGSTWQTTEPAKLPPRTGDPVVIKSAALGSYRASFAGGYAVRIQRIE